MALVCHPRQIPLEGAAMTTPPDILRRGTKRHSDDDCDVASPRAERRRCPFSRATGDSYAYHCRPRGPSTPAAFSEKAISDRVHRQHTAESHTRGPESSHSPIMYPAVRRRRARVLVSTYCSMADHLRESAAVAMVLDVLGPDDRGYHFVYASDILRSASAGEIGKVSNNGKDQQHFSGGPALRRLGLLEARADELRHG
jgi:hypothetical protein